MTQFKINQRNIYKCSFIEHFFLTRRKIQNWVRTNADEGYIDLRVVVILIIRIKMGCGAICGDNNAVEAVNKHNNAHQIMQSLITTLNKTSILATKKSIETFIELYKQNPKKFHLSPKPHLTADEEVSNDILIKWKLVLFGLDSDKKKYSNCLGLSQKNDILTQNQLNEQSSIVKVQETIIFHQCFIQIEKDLDRTMTLPIGRKRDFQNVLKRIANFFPKMGYTQGLNFIIGYLIIIGYSQNDTFWIFAHIALNRRYLFLGLYQDGFPVSNVLIIVFKNVLKRINNNLYQHIFQVLQIYDSIWIFKWFTTCFIYSFPLQLIKYIWDLVIQMGSMGMVTFAISLIIQLQPFLMKYEDTADATQFIQSLKTLQVMNHYVNTQRVIKGAFQIQIVFNDFDGVEGFGGFYGVYMKQIFKQTFHNESQIKESLPKFQDKKKSQQLLDQWYIRLIEERQTFLRTKKTTNTLDMPLLIDSNQKGFKRSESGNIKLMNCSTQKQHSSKQGSKVRKGSVDLTKDQLKAYRLRMQNLFDKINEKLDEQSKSQKSKRSKMSSQSKRSHRNNDQGQQSRSIRQSVAIKQVDILDELDKFQKEFDVKSKKSVIVNNYASPQNASKQLENSLVSNYGNNLIKMPPLSKANKDNTFGTAGRNCLKIQNYDASSVASKVVINKSTIKVNNMTIGLESYAIKAGRFCACKTKTQENKLSNRDKNSQLASSKGQFSDKDSISNQNLSNNEQPSEDLKSVSNEKIQSYRDRVTTLGDFMINSQGPSLKEKQVAYKNQEKNSKKIVADNEVVVLPFKKIKTLKEGKISHIEISKRQVPSDQVELHYDLDQESLESIHPYFIEKLSDQRCLHKGQDCVSGVCQIESVR